MILTDEHVILDLMSEDEERDWDEGEEDSLSVIAGVRAELAAGDLRPLYLAWLAAYGLWEQDEEAFEEEDEQELEPPVPAGLGSLTGPQRALADFLRLDADLLAVAAEASPSRPGGQDGIEKLAAGIAGLPVGEKDRLLLMVAQDQGARVKMELLRGLRGNPDNRGNEEGSQARRTVGALLDAANKRGSARWGGKRDPGRKVALQYRSLLATIMEKVETSRDHDAGPGRGTTVRSGKK
jgi:hypothetical protein